MSGEMKILYINPSHYDYLTATLVEGLIECGCEVRASETSNYAVGLPDEDIVAYAEQADLIVVAHGNFARRHLLQSVGNPRIVFVDGDDRQGIWPPDTIRFKAIFKRELNRRYPNPERSSVFALPFAAERRYFSAPAPHRNILVSFLANLGANTLRQSVHQRLVNFGHAQVFSGTTGESAYDESTPKSSPIDTPVYRDALNRSLISVNVPGAGYDCARFWEILAAGAMLFSYEPDIVIPDGFTDGLDFVSFKSLDEFEEKLMYYGNRLDAVREIAARGHQRLLAHHTTRARAAYFLEIAKAQVARAGYCEEWFRAS